MSEKNRISMCFNASTNMVGGAVQNSANFMVYAENDNEIDWSFIVSPEVLGEAQKIGFEGTALPLTPSPARSLISRQKLFRYVQSQSPSLVYTMAGPAYASFPCLHVMGCSNPYLTNLNWQSLCYDRSLLDIARTSAKTLYQAYHARKADFWIFQTESSRKGFSKRFFIPEDKTDVVANALGKAFSEERFSCVSWPTMGNSVLWGVYPAAYYPHKAHIMIPYVLSELKKMELPFEVRMMVTVKKNSTEEKKLFNAAREQGVERLVYNIGPFSYSDAPKILKDSDFVFFPSILEVFSTSYIETMAAKRPLIVADKEFAREVCGDYAFYFQPLCEQDAAKKIADMIHQERDRKSPRPGVATQETISLPNYEERYNRLKKILLKRISG